MSDSTNSESSALNAPHQRKIPFAPSKVRVVYSTTELLDQRLPREELLDLLLVPRSYVVRVIGRRFTPLGLDNSIGRGRLGILIRVQSGPRCLDYDRLRVLLGRGVP